MNNRLEIQSAIGELPEREVLILARWLQEYIEGLWEAERENEVASVSLDRLLEKTEVDIDLRRQEIANNIEKSQQEYREGRVFRGTIDDIIAELNDE
jgi:hypothetical protein